MDPAGRPIASAPVAETAMRARSPSLFHSESTFECAVIERMDLILVELRGLNRATSEEASAGGQLIDRPPYREIFKAIEANTAALIERGLVREGPL